MSDRKALAALEFALATPLLVITLTGAADFGMTQNKRVRLAETMQATSAYINAAGLLALQGNPQAVETFIRSTMNVPDADLSVRITGPAKRCISAAGTLTVPFFTGICPIDALPASDFVIVAVTYSNPGLLAGSLPASMHVLNGSVAVRVTTP